MITKYTNEQLAKKILELKNTKFKKCSILNSKISNYLNLNCNWNGYEYKTNVYLETLQNDNLCINVGLSCFPFTNDGINKAVEYINE